MAAAPAWAHCSSCSAVAPLAPMAPTSSPVLDTGTAPRAGSIRPPMVAMTACIIDIIGDSVYLLYANLFDLTRQTARVPGRDRTDARRICTCAAGLCCGLCRTLSARQDLG